MWPLFFSSLCIYGVLSQLRRYHSNFFLFLVEKRWNFFGSLNHHLLVCQSILGSLQKRFELRSRPGYIGLTLSLSLTHTHTHTQTQTQTLSLSLSLTLSLTLFTSYTHTHTHRVSLSLFSVDLPFAFFGPHFSRLNR